MIKDKLTNADTYYGISERLKQGFEWLKNNDLLNIPDGRYLIDGEKIFANVQSYITKVAGRAVETVPRSLRLSCGSELT